jgi:basic amino acid/polyamine antiporter, APA family
LRQRLHLRLLNHRRVVRLDYQLGLDSRVLGGIATWLVRYVVSFFSGIATHFPAALANAPLVFKGGWAASGAIFNLLAVLIVLAVTVILILGIRESSGVNAVIVAIKLAIILPFCRVLFSLCKTGELGPVYSTQQRVLTIWLDRNCGRSRCYFLRLYRVRCRNHGSPRDQETSARSAERHLGLAHHLYDFYVLVWLVLTGVVNYKQLDLPAPAAFAIQVGPS